QVQRLRSSLPAPIRGLGWPACSDHGSDATEASPHPNKLLRKCNMLHPTRLLRKMQSVGDPGSALALRGACPGIVPQRGPGPPRICIISANSWGGLSSVYHGYVVLDTGTVQARRPERGGEARAPPPNLSSDELLR